MYTNSGTIVSYIKWFARFVVLNILWFSVADTRMCRSSVRAINIHTVIDVTHFTSYIEYLIDRIFHTNRRLFAFTSVACSTFNLNEKSSVVGRF